MKAGGFWRSVWRYLFCNDEIDLIAVKRWRWVKGRWRPYRAPKD